MTTRPNCPDCKGYPSLVKVGPTGHEQYFIICQAEVHRRRPDGAMTEHGKILSDGFDAPGKAESQWAETARKRAAAEFN